MAIALIKKFKHDISLYDRIVGIIIKTGKRRCNYFDVFTEEG